uniref:ComEC/Rec2 family competence protein n=1 Tax=Allocatelliglobosispora scoriae TaxID=643052 RepID=UPI0016176606
MGWWQWRFAARPTTSRRGRRSVGGWPAGRPVPPRARSAPTATSNAAERSLADAPSGLESAEPAVGAGPGGWHSIAAAALLGLVIGAVATGARLVTRDSPALHELISTRATVGLELVVSDDPHLTAGRQASWAVPARLVVVEPPDRPPLRIAASVLLLATDPRWEGLLPGQRVRTTGRLGAARGGDLRAAVVTVSAEPMLMGAAPWVQRAAGGLREGLRQACAGLDPRPGGLLPGLVVGDVSRLSPEVAQDFVDTGMTHLTAVSGSNVAIVVGALLLLARWCRAGPALTAMICAIGVVGFVILARPSPSVLRAAVMGGLALIALSSGRNRAALPALAATITLLIVADPELAADAGFALSVCATAGILLIAPGWRDALVARRWPRAVAEAVAVPAAAQVACAPVVAAISASVSLVAIPANLIATMAIAPATVLGVAAAALSTVWPTGAAFVAWLGGWPCWGLVLVAGTGADVPGGLVPWPDGTPGALLLAGVTVLAMLGFRHRILRRLAVVVLLAGVVGALPIRLLAPGWPPEGWVVVACDVGQGDALVLPAGPGRAIVIDAGPDRAAVESCLDALDITEVPLLIVSHFHLDHIGGIAGVFAGRRVSAVLTTGWPEPVEGRESVARAAAAGGAALRVGVAGEVLTVGEVTLRVVGPVVPLHGTRSDPNNNSLVVHATVAGVGILLTGDAETEEQEELVGVVGRVDVLKTAHHGSAFQSPELLDASAPRVALVSVGTGNDYGHPNVALLTRLTRAGARVVRTDLDGDIAVVRLVTGQLGVVTHG